MAASFLDTGIAVRRASRLYSYNSSTSGLAPSHLQANLIVLPSRYAADFRLLCKRNPVPCPLLAESATIGSYNELQSHIDSISGQCIASDIDIRQDAPRYHVYRDGKLIQSGIPDITRYWTEDHVAFLIGCSYSFENALTLAGLPPRHTEMKRVVPMYKTTIPLCPAGIFTGGHYVVSMRPYLPKDVDLIRDITRPFVATHGEPIAWGWEAVQQLGIKDIAKPDWGEAPLTHNGRPFVDSDPEIPVFWGCGVTPQLAVMSANLKGVVMGHAPGHMIVLDVKEEDVFNI